MKTTILSLLGMAVLLSTQVLAQSTDDALRFGSSNKGVGTRALGMGNAYIGVADDFSATYWNPAGLAQMRRIEISGGLTNNSYSNDATFFGGTLNDKQTSTKLDNLGFAFPFPTLQGSFVLSFGYNRVADYTSGVSYDGFNPNSSIIPTLIANAPDDASDIPFQIFLESPSTSLYTPITKNVQQTGLVKESGGLGNWAFAGAMDVAKDLSFGLTLNVLNGSYQYLRNYLEVDTRNFYNNQDANLPADSAYLRFNKFYYDNTITSDINGVNFLFGMMYRADRYRVGITIKTPTSIKVTETTTDAGESVFDNNFNPGTRTYSVSANNDYGVKTPWTFGVGASVEPLYGLLLSGDIEYTDWTQLEWTDNSTLELGNSAMQQSLRAVTNLHVGAEYEIPGTDVSLRAGYMNQPSMYAGDPSSYDNSTFTGGAGILLQNNVQLDLAAAFGSFKTYHVNYTDANLLDASRTDESIKTTRVNFTISYRF